MVRPLINITITQHIKPSFISIRTKNVVGACSYQKTEELRIHSAIHTGYVLSLLTVVFSKLQDLCIAGQYLQQIHYLFNHLERKYVKIDPLAEVHLRKVIRPWALVPTALPEPTSVMCSSIDNLSLPHLGNNAL